ncbi:hypothetical protein Dsin_001490 [Dipteronia sinensis]|uniref:Reverse transcriptase n=1 Tax=Dipteronia sinensis TaxID=43782 RepID=A0AAE0B5P9_9ROSI|nr:hypothetical protein Dsin_001490 [Dipteronia sinensis]
MITRNKGVRYAGDSNKSTEGIVSPDSSSEKWNLEVKSAQVFEEAVKVGTNIHAAPSKENRDKWILETEVAKVIETGVSLGLDFSNKNSDLVKEISNRELGDEERVVRNLGGAILNRGVGVEAVGSAGGLIILWNDEEFKCISCITNDLCIILMGELISVKKKQAVFCNIYEPNVERERILLWEFLIQAQASLPHPLCFGEDFNTVMDPSERKGGLCSRSFLKSFNEFILKAKVIDILMHCSKFTWSNNREKGSWAKLDRFLLSPTLLSWFPNLVQHFLLRNISDHSMVVLGEPKMDWGPTPFRFFNHWMEDKEMLVDAMKGWNDCNIKGSKGLVLFNKANAAKIRMKRWVKVKKSGTSSIPKIEKQLGEAESKAVTEGWTMSLRNDMLTLISAL